MITNLKARWAIVVLVVVLALIWVYPSFKKLDKEDFWFTHNEITMGLDIQGGLHLVLGVDVQSVIREKVTRLGRNFSAELKEEKLSFKDVQVDPNNDKQILVDLNSAAEKEAILAYLEKNYAAVLQVFGETETQMQLRYYEARAIEYQKQTIAQAIEVIRNRIDALGVAEPSITAQGADRILVQLPGLKEEAVARSKELINKTARLDFRRVDSTVTELALNEMIAEAEKAGGYSLSSTEEGGLKYNEYMNRLNEDLKAKLPKQTRVVFEKFEQARNMEAGKRAYLIDMNSNLTGGQLDDAFVGAGEFGTPEVVFRFSVEGRRRFAELTRKAAGGNIAVVLDDVIKSAPTVREEIDSQTARITLGAGGNYEQNRQEADLIATALRAGALPASLEQLEERTVGPTLGQDSIEKGKLAGMVGGLLVLLFMFVYYRFLGFVANVSLAANVLLILALLSALGATLTLPGVAGIILTIGMAVDANVIIFERIKEELRKGGSVKVAVKDGFDHALSAILDANITTAIVCIVLMYFGTGPVRGFAVTLLCGIVTSLFTAIFVSRTIVEWAIVKLKIKKLTAY